MTGSTDSSMNTNMPTEQHGRNIRHCWVLREYERHHSVHRPHWGIANARPLRPLPEPIADPVTLARLPIRRRDRLGGILHEYEHAP